MPNMPKTSAQLNREIAEALSHPIGSADTASTISDKASTNPAEWSHIFDSLKPGQIVYISMSAVMGMSRAESGDYHPHKVGRRSKAKRPQWWTEAIALEPADGRKVPSFAKYKLWKSKDGRISMSHGDMAVTLKGIYAP